MPVSEPLNNEEHQPSVGCLFTPVAMHVLEDLSDDIPHVL